MSVDLETIGGIVAFRRENGSMAMCTWSEPTQQIWALFDCLPYDVPLRLLRDHMIEAFIDQESAPHDAVECTCFVIDAAIAAHGAG